MDNRKYAGYIYCCFTDTKEENVDVQQIHFFLSEDGLNWTALNGNEPAFLAGSDFTDRVEPAGKNSVNYVVKDQRDIRETQKGDASVLFPFEGKDHGVRDPYLIRGAKKDGSDADKIWLVATDLNTHCQKYGDSQNLARNICGSWPRMTNFGNGSRCLFIWETTDWIHWERRYVDVGTEVNSCMAWAPEAIYNPAKDNYLVYWSARTADDAEARDRLYCNETDDFITFGPTMLYEQEGFYKKYGPKGVEMNDGYGNIDTSQLWVGDTLYRLVKDETDNHVELMAAKTVFDPKFDRENLWDKVARNAKNQWEKVVFEEEKGWHFLDGTPADGKIWDYYDPKIKTGYELEGVRYEDKEALILLRKNDPLAIKTAEIVYHWYKDRAVGNHFERIPQEGIEKYRGAYEGATMFRFIDREEWCVMIDFYGDMSVRYEPYVTKDLSKADSIRKLTGGYGRTGGDIGGHGTVIPITAEEYNRMLAYYNDPEKMTPKARANYHEIKKLPLK